MAEGTFLTYVTGNGAKLREAKAVLEPLGFVVVGRTLPLVEPQLDSPRDVALAKAEQAYALLGQPVVTDDTALFAAGWRAFPGAYTSAMARLLGARGLGRLFDEGQRATFRCFLCYHDGTPRVFEGAWRGRLRRVGRLPRNSWPYDTMFLPDGYDVPLAKIPFAERAQRSHRRRALLLLSKFLKGNGSTR